MKIICISLLTSFACLIGNISAQSPNYLWAKSAGGTGTDVAYSCCTDISGNIIIAGTFSSPTITFGTITLTNAGNDDMFIVKYDPNGIVLWAKSEGGIAIDRCYSCYTDNSGNIIATGYFCSSPISFGTTVLTNAGASDIFIVKYNPSGNVLWAKSFGGTSWDLGNSCSTDASGNIFATGSFQSPTITVDTTVLINAGNHDMFMVKCDPNGNAVWAKSAGGAFRDEASYCATDTAGNIIATGYFYSSSISFGTNILTNTGNDNFFIVKYDASGNVLWSKYAGGSLYDEGCSCSTDEAGNIITTGYFESPTITFDSIVLTNAGSSDMFIAKYDPNGNVQWAKSVGGPSLDMGTSCTTDASGNIVAIGNFESPSINIGTTVMTNSGVATDDILIVKYDSSGNVLWVKSAGGSSIDACNGCSLDANGKIFVTGIFFSPTISFGTTILTNAGNHDMFIVKLDTAMVTGVDEMEDFRNEILLFPNPAGNHLTIGLGCSKVKTNVTITDISGKNIFSTTAPASQNILVNTNDFVEGIYVVQIQTTDFIVRKKVSIFK